ncbi:reverse transcriptase [Plakobranchus ocellatus]|uniref:Reverse transcriptase n=1 Tax=Plakobranchus ocellatus TaxID=259542 RepID=A0AAV4CEM9_9GAST|nr:reverse transcriptase [Plakobranchus ocellatus]
MYSVHNKEILGFQALRQGQGADGGARTHAKNVPADLGADSLSSVPTTPPEIHCRKLSVEGEERVSHTSTKDDLRFFSHHQGQGIGGGWPRAQAFGSKNLHISTRRRCSRRSRRLVFPPKTVNTVDPSISRAVVVPLT